MFYLIVGIIGVVVFFGLIEFGIWREHRALQRSHAEWLARQQPPTAHGQPKTEKLSACEPHHAGGSVATDASDRQCVRAAQPRPRLLYGGHHVVTDQRASQTADDTCSDEAESGARSFPNTEPTQPGALPAKACASGLRQRVVESAPEGPGTDGNKPLMRNRVGDECPSAKGYIAGKNLPHYPQARWALKRN